MTGMRENIYEEDWNCAEHPDAICGCGLGVGEMQIRRGVLCNADVRGRLYLRAARRKDVQLARRVVAAVKSTALASEQLPADILGIREKT